MRSLAFDLYTDNMNVGMKLNFMLCNIYNLIHVLKNYF